MNILKLNSVEEIKQYNTLIGYFEVDGKFYTTCPNCGNPIALDRHVTRVDLLRDNDTLERLEFCSVQCAWDWQLDTSCCEYETSPFPWFVICEDTKGVISYHKNKFEAEEQASISRNNNNIFNYVVVDIEDIKQPYQIRSRESGDVIDRFATLDIAKRFLEDYEKEDKANGEFEPNFYEIYNQDTHEVEE